jgi:hypothetical protein
MTDAVVDPNLGRYPAAGEPHSQLTAEDDFALWARQFNGGLLRRWCARLLNSLSQAAIRDGIVLVWGGPAGCYCIFVERPAARPGRQPIAGQGGPLSK